MATTTYDAAVIEGFYLEATLMVPTLTTLKAVDDHLKFVEMLKENGVFSDGKRYEDLIGLIYARLSEIANELNVVKKSPESVPEWPIHFNYKTQGDHNCDVRETIITLQFQNQPEIFTHHVRGKLTSAQFKALSALEVVLNHVVFTNTCKDITVIAATSHSLNSYNRVYTAYLHELLLDEIRILCEHVKPVVCTITAFWLRHGGFFVHKDVILDGITEYPVLLDASLGILSNAENLVHYCDLRKFSSKMHGDVRCQKLLKHFSLLK